MKSLTLFTLSTFLSVASCRTFNLGDGQTVDLEECTVKAEDVDSLEKIDNLKQVPVHCYNKYITQYLHKKLDDNIKDYQKVLDDDYDHKFQVYAGYINEQVPAQIDEFMSKRANEFFKCTQNKSGFCCKDLTQGFGSEGCDHSADCDNSVKWRDVKCPDKMPNKEGFDLGADQIEVDWELKDEAGFWKALTDDQGIQKDWVKFDKRMSSRGTSVCFNDPKHNGCADSKKFWTNFPTRSEEMEVPNPKDMIDKSKKGFEVVRDSLEDAATDWESGKDVDLSADIVDAASLPAFLIPQAITSMKDIVDTAEDIEEAERKEMILNFIGAALVLIPGLGSAIEGVGLAAIGRIISMMGEVGNAALGIYETVQDPKNAIFLMFGALTEFGRAKPQFTKAAGARRKIDPKTVEGLGKDVKWGADRIDTLKVGCI